MALLIKEKTNLSLDILHIINHYIANYYAWYIVYILPLRCLYIFSIWNIEQYMHLQYYIECMCSANIIEIKTKQYADSFQHDIFSKKCFIISVMFREKHNNYLNVLWLNVSVRCFYLKRKISAIALQKLQISAKPKLKSTYIFTIFI